MPSKKGASPHTHIVFYRQELEEDARKL